MKYSSPPDRQFFYAQVWEVVRKIPPGCGSQNDQQYNDIDNDCFDTLKLIGLKLG